VSHLPVTIQTFVSLFRSTKHSHGCIRLACSPDDLQLRKPQHCLEIGALCSSPILRPDKALESRIFCNNGMLVAALQVAPKDVAKGGSERREAFRKAIVTGAKEATESRNSWYDGDADRSYG